MVFLILFLVGAVLTVYLTYKYATAEKVAPTNLICFAGTLGAGKTYMGVRHALKLYRKQRLKHKVYRLWKGFAFFVPEAKYPAHLFSNIPIKINKKTMSEPFKVEHLLLKELLPEAAVVFCDEFGAMASQWEYDNPNVVEYVHFFARFFRHFTGGYFVATDQTSGDMVKQVRSRLGVVYMLSNFHRKWGFLPMFEVDFIPLLPVEDTATNVEHDEDDAKKRYFMGALPYKWMKGYKHYDTRCYKPLYSQAAVRDVDCWAMGDLSTTYLIDIGVSQRARKEYKTNRDKWREFFYSSDRASFSADAILSGGSRGGEAPCTATEEENNDDK